MVNYISEYVIDGVSRLSDNAMPLIRLCLCCRHGTDDGDNQTEYREYKHNASDNMRDGFCHERRKAIRELGPLSTALPA